MATLQGSKETRLNVRITDREKQLIERAAAAAHLSTSAFILRAASIEAEAVLTSRAVFELDPERWEAFIALLDREPQVKPALRNLLLEDDVFNER
jgi:uncharacterized protein (DUF1778 family)